MVLAVLGVSGAGTMIARQGAAGPAAVTSAAAPSPAGSASRSAAEAAEVRPGGLLRPLALIADSIEPAPMFVPDESGRPRLSTAYREALEGGRLLGPAPAVEVAPAAGAGTTAGAGYSGRPAASLFDELRASPQERALVAHVRELTARNGIDVRFVVATLPDWVDSSLQWTFDPMLDALQMAAGQMGYVPIGFHIPDAESAGQERTPSARSRSFAAHESEPGVVLFRRERRGTGDDAGGALRHDLLAVLLVGETATGGIHPQALAAALDLALLWQRAPLGILGPTYSGSAESLRRSLRLAVQRHRLGPQDGTAWFRIVSGSATSPGNLRYLAVPGVSSFRATTRSDDDALLALTEYLGGIDADWRCGRKVALLVEANTTWGRRFYASRGPANLQDSATAPPPADAAEPSACGRCRAAPHDAPLDAPLLPCATILPFPLHVSRLRGEATLVNRAQAELGLPARSKVSLPLAEPGAPIDRLPSFSPVLTAANVETMLRGVFSAIEERGITAVGVLATDKRDHVFLAQEIARRTPNVLSFTLESNLVYLHPDVSSYVRGTVVASAYSLYDRTQFLTRPALANHYRQQFGSVAAQGAFNALLALAGEPQQMLDYDDPAGPGETVAGRAQTGPCRPGHASCAPPVWISVVARNALLPLTSDSPGRCPDAQGYTLCAAGADPASADAGRRQQDYLGRHGLFRSLAALLVAVLAWHVLAVLRRQLAEPGGRTVQRERLASRFACEAALIALGLWLLKLALVLLADARQWPPANLAPYYGAACAFGAAWIVQRALDAFWRRRDARGLAAVGGAVLFVLAVGAWCLLGAPDARLAAVKVAVVAWFVAMLADFDLAEWRSSLDDVQRWRRWPVLLGLGALLCLLADLTLRSWTGVEAVLWAERTALLGSLASPAPVIAGLCGAVYWWGAWNLRRVQLMRLPEIEVGVGELIEGRARRAGTAPKRIFERPTLSIGPFVAVPVAGLVVALVIGRDFVASIDGRLFAGFLLLGAACVVAVMGHTLAHSAHLGRAIFHTLHALHRHPATSVFEQLGKEPFHWRLGYREPRIPDFEPLVRRIQLTAHEAGAWTDADSNSLGVLGVPDRATWLPLAGEIVRAMKFDRHDPATGGPMRVEDWTRLDELTRAFKSVLRRTRWRAGYDGTGCSAALRATVEHMEYVVMFHGAVVLRDLLTRLVSGFTAVLGGLLLLTLAHLLYTFQGRAFWLALDWTAMGIAALVAIRTLARIERDVVLSRLWATQPGRISLFGGLSWRMLAYVGITLVTLFAVFFPEVGGGLLRWLEPARRALP